MNGRASELSAFASAVLLALFPGVLKLYKAFVVTEGAPPAWDLFVIIAPDLLWAAGIGLLLLGLVRKLGGSRAGTLVCWLLTTLIMVVVSGLSAIEHQTWVKTASLLDWGILSYTIRHYAELQIVIASEASTAGALLFVGAGVIALLPVLLDMGLGHRLRVPRLPETRARRAGLLALCASFAALACFSPQRPELVPVSHSAAISLVVDALRGTEQAAESADTDVYEPSPDVAKQRVAQQLAAAGVTLDTSKSYPKNVLIFILESTRYDATTLYSPKLDTTPRLARMAEHGAVAERVYVDMPHTSKAITSVLCGYAPRWSVEINEAEINGLPGACGPHVLGELGYQTAFFQSASGTFENRQQFVANAGFQTFVARESLRDSRFAEVNYLAIEDKAMTAPILRFVDQSKGKPFFAAVMTCGSHHMYGLPSGFRMQRYPRSEAAPSGRLPRPWDDYNRYLNTVRYVDDFISDVVKGLAQRGLLDETLIVVVGDHGQGFMEHGEKFHNDVIHEEGLRVPLLFHNKLAFPEPRRIPGLRRQVDILPTTLSLLGVKYPEDLFEGRDILSSPGAERVLSNCWYDERCAAQIEGTVKVIDYFKNRPGEIYDLSVDPYEQNELLAKSSGDKRERLEQRAALAHANIVAEKQRLEARYRGSKMVDRSFVLDEAPTPSHVVPARLGSYVELLGYDSASHEVTPGSTWEAVMYFRCLQPSAEGWRLFGRFETVDNRRQQIDYNPANGRFDLKDCKPGMLIADRLRMWVPEDFPPGPLDFYWGSVLLPEKGFTRVGNERLDKRDVIALERGVVVRDQGVRLARLTVLPKYRDDLANVLRTAVLTERKPIADSLEVRLGGGIVLEEAHVEPLTVRPFGTLRITCVWRVEARVQGPWQMFTHFDTGPREDSRVRAPVDGVHPITNWKPGTWVRDTYTLVLPAWLRSGTADIWVGFVYERKHMKVNAPGRATVDRRKRIKIATIQVTPQ